MLGECLVVRDERMLDHLTRGSHPERPERLRVIWDGLAGCAGIRFISAERATREQIERIHSSDHYETVSYTAGHFDELDVDTPVSPNSFEAAMLAAGATIAVTKAVVQGKARCAFALVRPPGHHAESERAMGFCLFNNVAIAAAEARATLGCERVLIVDWDVHHGNGTQGAFFDRRDVLFFSIHQAPLYPGSGWLDQIGEGAGLGHTVNVPLPPGSGDAEYQAAFQELLVPIADAYRPDLVLVSAGFDPHREDPLANMDVSDHGFAAMTSAVRAIADRHAQGRLVLVLEGGYDLDALSRNVRQTIDILTSTEDGAARRVAASVAVSRPSGAEPPGSGAVSPQARAILERVRERQQRFWPL